MQRLSAEYLSQINFAKPTYNRHSLLPGIVHLGIGAFHRAHQAWYTDAVMNRLGGNWGIIGCSLRAPAVKHQLQPQDGLYTLIERGKNNSPQIIGSVLEVLVGPENPQAIIDAIALPSVKLISLTITEKGYCHLPSTGQLNFQHPDIQRDIANPNAPVSAVGFIVAGLLKRFKNKLEPISILSCDNLPHNGAVVRAVVIELAEHIDPALAQWVYQHVTFPSTMVDRIVPASTATDYHWLEEHSGYQDEGLVVAEPFSQWVIEDNFCNTYPAWDQVGALLVKDVGVYETMKLRLLNGSHSLLAYAGFLAGYETIYQVMQDADFVVLTQQFMHSAAQTLEAPENFNLTTYQQQLITRFSNPGLQHRTEQIAMDGSQKIPQRWLNSLRHAHNIGNNTEIFAFALAAWMRYLHGTDEAGNRIAVSDPLAAPLMQIVQDNTQDIEAMVAALFSFNPVFGEEFAGHKALQAQTSKWLKRIHALGIKPAIALFISQVET